MGEELAAGLFLESIIFSDFGPVGQTDAGLWCKGANFKVLYLPLINVSLC